MGISLPVGVRNFVRYIGCVGFYVIQCSHVTLTIEETGVFWIIGLVLIVYKYLRFSPTLVILWVNEGENGTRI